jgi:hypothetical protein
MLAAELAAHAFHCHCQAKNFDWAAYLNRFSQVSKADSTGSLLQLVNWMRHRANCTPAGERKKAECGDHDAEAPDSQLVEATDTCLQVSLTSCIE